MTRLQMAHIASILIGVASYPQGASWQGAISAFRLNVIGIEKGSVAENTIMGICLSASIASVISCALLTWREWVMPRHVECVCRACGTVLQGLEQPVCPSCGTRI
jgi:hypothetical protein